MSEKIRVFLDTNLFVDYLILLNLRGKRKKELKDRYKNSYDFMKKVITKKNSNFSFITSSLSRAEIYNSLLNEYRCDKMYKKGIPLNCWEHEKQKEKLEESEISDIVNSINLFTDSYIYFEGDKEKRILSVLDAYNVKIFADLVMKFDVRTHDAIIVATAVDKKCECFITRDNRLRKQLKDKKYDKIELLCPEEASKLLLEIRKLKREMNRAHKVTKQLKKLTKEIKA
jgi:predicted nucleic acid-binding protein